MQTTQCRVGVFIEPDHSTVSIHVYFFWKGQSAEKAESEYANKEKNKRRQRHNGNARGLISSIVMEKQIKKLQREEDLGKSNKAVSKETNPNAKANFN